MKYVKIFEDEDDMLTRYRELYDLGLISLEDYYGDLKAAGYSVEEYYIKGQPFVDLDVSEMDRFSRDWLDRAFREQVLDWVHRKSGARILSVRAKANPFGLECRLELTSGEVLGFGMVSARTGGLFTGVELNGAPLDKDRLRAWNQEFSQAVRESLGRLSKDWPMVLMVGFRTAADLAKEDK